MEHCPNCDDQLSRRFVDQLYAYVMHCWRCGFHAVSRP